MGRIGKIVSGGQTGADRGGLDAAMYCDIPCGGWVPKGRLAEDGHVPDRYAGMQEHASPKYGPRTEANVVDSDATVVCTKGPPEGGSAATVKYAERWKRPCLAVDVAQGRETSVRQVVEWLRGLPGDGLVLNVAGSRESKVPGLQRLVGAWMVDVISQVNGKLFYPVDEDCDLTEAGGTRGEIPPALAAELARMRQEMDRQAEAMRLYHPASLDEAVACVLGELGSERRAEILAMGREEFLTAAHLGLGQWIRNAMFYRNEKILDLKADLQRRWPNEREVWAEADGFSRKVLEGVWAAVGEVGR